MYLKKKLSYIWVIIYVYTFNTVVIWYLELPKHKINISDYLARYISDRLKSNKAQNWCTDKKAEFYDNTIQYYVCI